MKRPGTTMQLKGNAGSFRSLARFMLGYAALVALFGAAFPLAAEFAQNQYDALAGSIRLLAIMAFFSGVAVLHIAERNARWRQQQFVRR
jgi:hypothetical protein